MPVVPKSLRRNGDMSSHARNRNRPAPPERRFRGNVTNPAYITQVSQSQYRVSPAEALTKMKMLEHCDRAVINPMFHRPSSDLPSNDPKINEFISVDKAVINLFFGRGVPDYNKIKASQNEDTRSNIHTPPDNWVDQYPLHSAAYEGNANAVRQLLHMGYPADQPDVHLWVPLHYACWNGHVEAVKTLLLDPNCSPNTENDSGSAPLHFSAFKGHSEVVRLLLNHRDIDKLVVNKEGRTPLQLCEESRQNDWETTVKLLKEAARKPPHKIDVHLMDLDGSHVVLDLNRGSNTSIGDLVQQLQLPRGGHHIFAVWIASQNLHLQMRPEHKPVLHLKQWDSIIRQLTNYNPDTERPLLYLRRDALLTVEDERAIRDPQAIKMLFDECLLNVLKGMYPSTDTDAITLAGIYMQITYGDHDAKRHRAGFLNNINLRHFIPGIKLEAKGQGSRGINWAQKIVNEHRNVTQKGIRDVTKLQMMYLDLCRSFPVYGSAFFFGSAQLGGSRRGQGGSQRSPAVFVGVNSRGIHLINAISKTMILSVGYKQGLTWEVSSDMLTLTLLIQDGNGYRTLPVKTKQAAIISNLANKLSGRLAAEDQPSTSRANSLQRH
ncbi:krev interaction trapped protein 1-like [Diadema antillarum]|uniref:krev interaction trapped protein 1-like n=1 Tax=Diadema antillarum TaxID=105358 RepID=UPI003A87E031